MIYNGLGRSSGGLAADERRRAGAVSDDFGLFLDLIAPEKGLVALLAAYLDASEQPHGGVFAVAGLAFEVPQAKKISKELTKLFAPYGGIGHMTDLHARKRQFKALDGDEREVRRLTVQQIHAINKRVSFGVGVGVDLKEINAFLPKHVEGLGHAFPFCCHMAMQALGGLVKRERGGDQIAYVFECGDEHQREAHRFMENVHQVPTLKDAYQHYSHAFIGKEQAPPLTAADAFAWEYARYWDQTVLKGKIKMRKSLVSLLSSGHTTLEFQRKYSVNFFTGPVLWDSMQKIKLIFQG